MAIEFMLLSLSIIIQSIAGTEEKSKMIPTSSHWDQFRCFTEMEIKDAFGYIPEDKHVAEKLEILSLFNFKLDDWSFQSLGTAIIARELLGVNVELFKFEESQDVAAWMAEEYDTASNVAIFHSGMMANDYQHVNGIEDVASPITSHIQWLISNVVAEAMGNELGVDNLYFTDWNILKNDAVLNVMHKNNDVVIPMDQEGNHCDESFGCLHGDSTWYPPQCDHNSNDCMVLLQFVPITGASDAELNRDLILENNLPIVVKYLGSKTDPNAQLNFNHFYNGNYRVIYQLSTMESQIVDEMGWTTILLPPLSPINVGQRLLYLRPSWLLDVAINLFVTHEHGQLPYGAHEFLHRAIVESGLTDTSDLRQEAMCQYIKNVWLLQDWPIYIAIPFVVMAQTVGEVHCDKVDDEALEFIINRDDNELLSGPIRDPTYFGDMTEIYDSFNALFAKRHCILGDYPEDKSEALFAAGYVLTTVTALLVLLVAMFTFKWRKEEIMKEASINVIALVFVGAVYSLSYCLFLEKDIVSHCIMREFIFQIGVVLMLGTLGAKTWRLQKRHESIKTLQQCDIADLNLLIRIGIVFLLILGYLTIILLVHPIEIKQTIVNRQRKTMEQWDGDTLYRGLLLVEALAVCVIGRRALSIRGTNSVHNEHRWIGCIMYIAVFIIGGYLVVDLSGKDANSYGIKSILVSLMTLFVISLLMIPKIVIQIQGTRYIPDEFDYDSITFSTTLLTQEDFERISNYLRRFGYELRKKERGRDELHTKHLRESDLSSNEAQGLRGIFSTFSAYTTTRGRSVLTKSRLSTKRSTRPTVTKMDDLTLQIR